MWAQICIQHMAQLANEATIVRCVVEPMFIYFDIGKHWSPVDGLALAVLCNMQLLMASILLFHVTFWLVLFIGMPILGSMQLGLLSYLKS